MSCQSNFKHVGIQFHAKTFKGLEAILAEELTAIGADDVTPVNRGVNFSGSFSMLYKANLYTRTALRILMPVAKFKAVNENMLYNKIMDIDWSRYMSVKNSFAVDAVTFSNTFRHSHYVEQKVKDAIVDQFRKNNSLRPSVDIKHPEIKINVHLAENFFTISLDSSGESLHKRGYRKHLHQASLSEVLAAGMVMLSGYKGELPLLDPMCGSGTIAIEAAMISSGMLPGHLERSYGFQYWTEYDNLLFNRIREAMPEPDFRRINITATDIDPEAVRITKTNARAAGLLEYMNIRRTDFLNYNYEGDPPVIIMNPPYGERLEVEDIETFYGNIGSVMKHKFPGAEAWVFSSNMDAINKLGLKPDRKIALFNGNLECRYQKYTLFSGSHKTFKERGE